VINEVAWAGTADSSNDEWIELYNNTGANVDLSGWKVDDNKGHSYAITGGVIAAHGYFLIEDSEASIGGIVADAIIGLTLVNTGEALFLKNAEGVTVDTVNESGMWYAGDSTSKATMERIDPAILADTSSNWATAKSGNGSSGRSGSAILGTARGANSNFNGGTRVALNSAKTNLSNGESFTVGVGVENILDLYAYGFEMNYDANVLEFVSASESDFLKNDGTTTSFNTALENGNQGKLIIGNARLLSPPVGINGSGDLVNITFKAIGASGTSADISFGASSFLADRSADIAASFAPLHIAIGQVSNTMPVTNLQANEGLNPYSFELKWNAPTSGAEKYIIKRQLPNGNFVGLGETTTLAFTDNDSVVNGGKIITGIEYNYQVISVKNGEFSSATTVTAIETRGLVGDNDRSGRVDGRDLVKLAKSYGSAIGDSGYDAIVDTTFDGLIDGSDLIDIGANFGVKM
jgi:hypothetical protein